MASYHFVLWLEGPGTLMADLEDRVYKAGCGDALLGVFSGRLFLEFDRDAASLLDAVSSAIRDVRQAGLSVERIGFEVDDFVTQAEIARKTERTTASVSQLINGARGPGEFPPHSHAAGTTKVWRWSEVQEWFHSYDGSQTQSADERILRGIASAFQLMRSVPDPQERDRILEQLMRAAHSSRRA